MSNNEIQFKLPISKTAIITTASVLSLSISTALYAAQPVGVQTTDNLLSVVASSPLPKRFIVKYKQAVTSQAAMSNDTSISNMVSSQALVRLEAVKSKLIKKGES